MVRSRYPDIELIYDDSFGMAGAVTSGKADAWVWEMSDEVEGDEELVVAQVLEEDFFTAFPINPLMPELKADIDTVLAEMIADGTYTEIYDRWLEDDLFRVGQ